MSKVPKIIKFILVAFLAWRISLVLVALAGVKFFPAKIDYLGGGITNYFNQPLLWGWANFDGVHYLDIAQQGYRQFEQAFFPFYPYFIRGITPLFLNNYLLAGLTISHLALLATLYLFYKLVKLDFQDQVAKRVIFYLLIFPAAFYFGSVYSESLFLALTLGAFYAARKDRWLLAGTLGAFASATRLVGIFLFPALIIEWWFQSRGKLRNIAPLFLIILGLVIYMKYLGITTGDPLYFIHVQPLFGAERSGEKLVLLYQVFWRYFKMIITTKLDPLYFSVWLEFLSGILFLGLSLLAYFRLRLSYFVFMILAYLTPTLTGTLSSLPRYVLVLFPGFILLAILAEKHRWLRFAYPLVAGILLIASTILFIRGFWVA